MPPASSRARAVRRRIDRSVRIGAPPTTATGPAPGGRGADRGIVFDATAGRSCARQWPVNVSGPLGEYGEVRGLVEVLGEERVPG
ncbi:hypothetical protein [Rhodococcus koreensis]